MRSRSWQLNDQRTGREAGSALLAALLLVVISGVMGATILFATSTDLQISGNYRRAVQSFYAAEAGLAEAQRRLMGSASSHPWYAGDPSPVPQQNWSAYVLSVSNWQWLDDFSFSSLLTNYVPANGNFTNTLILPNSLQSGLPYWVKIQHKTEYDAEQAGHTILVPHYVDGDGVLTTHSKTNRGNLLAFGYPSTSELRPVQFSAMPPSFYPPVEIIKSQGKVEGAVSIIQAEVARQPGPPVLAAVYAGTQADLLGNAIVIQGEDACGMVPTGLPPIALGPSATLSGTATFSGKLALPTRTPAILDLVNYIASFQPGLSPIMGDISGVGLGTSAAPSIQVAQPSGGWWTLSNVSGYGFLVIRGSLRIYPPFQWEGMILVSDQITIESGINPVVIRGAMLANNLQILNDDVKISLDTCPIAATLRMSPLKILNWRQLI